MIKRVLEWRRQLHQLPILMLVLALLLPAASAESIYPQTGGENTDFLQGPGGFDTTVLSTTTTRGLTDGDHIPLIADLDGDGENEIIIIDDGSIKLFRGPNLDVVDTVSLPSGEYSPPIINDIDSDGFLEIIIANEGFSNGNVTIAKFNGTDFFVQNTIDYSSIFPGLTGGGTREILLQCGDDQGIGENVSCLYVVFDSPQTTVERKILAHSFNANSRDSTAFDILFQTSDINLDICMPNVPTMTFTDFNVDGRGEFIFSAAKFMRSEGDELKIYYIDVAEDLSRTTDLEITFTSNFNPVTAGTPECRNDNLGKFFTSPVLANFDGATGNGLETVIGISEDADDFVMLVFNALGTKIKTHPTILQTDGELLGNPMVANIFGDTGETDYCVAGQDTDEQLIKLVCGSLLTSRSILFINVPTIEFGFDITDLFNLSDIYNFPSAVGHMSNMQEDSIDVTDQVGFTDITEFVGAHGVFQPTANDFPGIFTGNEMIRLFDFPTESACTVFDVEKIGAADIICVKDTAVTYINDNLINGIAAITAHTENPCIDAGPVVINTTFQVKIIAQDQNPAPLPQDLVTTTVKLYEGTSNEQVSVLANQTSGDEVTHVFLFPGAGINKTGSNIRLVYEAFDSENTGDVDSIVQTFTVSTAGVAFGDCTSGKIISLPSEEEELTTVDELAALIPDDQTDNGVTNAIITLSLLLGLGGTTIWLIVMLAMSIGVWAAVMRTGPNGHPLVHGSSALGMIAILNLLMIIIGARLGILSIALVVIIVIVAVVIIGVFLGKFLTGLNPTGGN